MKTVVITGANGFVGKNLVSDLEATTNYNLLKITRDTDEQTKKKYLLQADSLVHLAGVNRPQKVEEFKEGNVDLLKEILNILKNNPKNPNVILSSSSQVERDNLYGKSKLEGEKLLENFSKDEGNRVYIYRFPNLFGKWCKPNYNSVIATFCYNIARNKEIHINDENVELKLNYIDDVIKEIKKAIENSPTMLKGHPTVPNVYRVKLGEIVELLQFFKQTRIDKSLPDLSDNFEKDLYSTYLSYLPEDEFSYPLKMNIDNRGSFTEIIKTPDRGQVSVNISKPGITKGNHWHHTKNEKFLVVSGKGVIRFRKPYEKNIIEYYVSGDKLEVVDIPVGYTHNIENLGEEDMVTIMWVNEIFDPEKPDTYYLEV